MTGDQCAAAACVTSLDLREPETTKAARQRRRRWARRRPPCERTRRRRGRRHDPHLEMADMHPAGARGRSLLHRAVGRSRRWRGQLYPRRSCGRRRGERRTRRCLPRRRHGSRGGSRNGVLAAAAGRGAAMSAGAGRGSSGCGTRRGCRDRRGSHLRWWRHRGHRKFPPRPRRRRGAL